ncbi:MAG TPA: hypothetical protein VHU81_12960 [Thermoanaerobaculia bacterium]|nr:hypothetical protein [Thermoanaerobaculia bacterium]
MTAGRRTPRISSLFLLLAFLTLGLPRSGAAARAPELTFEGPAQYDGLARRLESGPARRLDTLADLVGLDDPGPAIRVVLAPESSPEARSAPAWVAGYALSESSTLILLPARTPSYPDGSFEDLLRHEVTHVLIDRAARGRPLPRWFHEGVAMAAGGSWSLEDRSLVTLALLTGRDVPLDELDRRFRGSSGEIARAYAMSGAFVRDLMDEHGPAVVGNILRAVRHGLPFPEAFRHVTGTSLAYAEEELGERQSFWYRWMPILSSSAALWLGITLLALLAIRRRRARDAARLRKWEEEERLADLLARMESQPPN